MYAIRSYYDGRAHVRADLLGSHLVGLDLQLLVLGIHDFLGPGHELGELEGIVHHIAVGAGLGHVDDHDDVRRLGVLTLEGLV